MAVDDQSETSFSISKETWPWQTVFVVFIHRNEFRHATPVASGATGRANDQGPRWALRCI